MPPAMNAELAVNRSFPSDSVTIGAGVAIFHIASSRVVVCYHSRDKYWFLPKGRKNANEDVRFAASREGFEESGYRNRLLPIPFAHRQTQPDHGLERYVTEAIWLQLLSLKPTVQYLLFWHIAETLPPELERGYTYDSTKPYQDPPVFPANMTIAQRIALDQAESAAGRPYEPVRYDATGVNEEEQCYLSFLLPIDEAMLKLGDGVMADVVRRGWAGIQTRMQEEAKAS